MSTLRRLRAFAGPWTLVWLLVATMVVVTAAVEVFRDHLDQQALRESVATAPYTDRDLFVMRTTRTGLIEPPRAQDLHREVLEVLPSTLSEVLETTWVYQFTEVSQLEGFGASLAGEGVTSEPAGFAPVISLHSQSGFSDDTVVVEGREPDSAAAGSLEVMVETEVADALGIEVGQDHVLQAGQIGISPDQVDGARALPVRFVGTYEVIDAQDPAWHHVPLLVEAGHTAIIQELSGEQPRAVRAGLYTDPEGIRHLSEEGMTTHFAPETVVRMRLDAQQIETAWVDDADDAVAQLAGSPEIFDARVRTGLSTILDRFTQRSAAVQALIGLVAAGAVGVGFGLLLVAAGLLIERRRGELLLVRARGARLVRIAGRMLAEATPIVVLAALAGWLAHRPLLAFAVDRWSGLEAAARGLPPTSPGLAQFGIVLVGLLAVPAAAVAIARRGGTQPQREMARVRPSLPRLTVEVGVVLLAMLGVVVLRQRGLVGSAGDTYLAMVPLLVSLAVGMLVLRAYPLPLRLLEPLTRRRAGAVGFLSLARVGRSTASTAWALLILVVAAALAGVSGGMLRAVWRARGPEAGTEAVGAFQDGLVLVLSTGGVIGITAALLAAALLLVMPAADRVRDLRLLRALGLPHSPARMLVLVEVLPPLLLAAAVGMVVGLATPVVLGPTLGVEAVLGATAPRFATDPVIVWALAVPLVALAGLGTWVTAARSEGSLDPTGATAGE